MTQDSYRQHQQNQPGAPLFQSERSWSMLDDDDDGDEMFAARQQHALRNAHAAGVGPTFMSEKSWSILPSNESEEHRFLGGYADNNASGLYGQDTLTMPPPPPPSHAYATSQDFSRESTAQFPEPEFAPSLATSTKEFLLDTFRFERRNPSDITGRPDEYTKDFAYQYDHPAGSEITDKTELTPKASMLNSPAAMGIGRHKIAMIVAPVVAAVVAYLVLYRMDEEGQFMSWARSLYWKE